MEKKNKIMLGILILVFFIGMIGIALARFSYKKSGENQQLVTGDIYMNYTESSALTIQNELSRSTYDPTRYFEFYIKGKNTNTLYDIYYDILIGRGDVPSGKTESNRIADRFLKFRLVERVNNADQVIFTDKSYVDLTSNQRVAVATIPKNTTSEVTHTYRLYMWIGDDVVVGNEENPVKDYTISEWNSLFGSVKVSATGDFDTKTTNDDIKGKILAEKNNSATYIKSYNTEVRGSNPSYTTQDTVETNSNKQDVLYYTGSDAISHGNVLFAGYCWQIVRTTDTGGVKLIYNGIAVDNECGDRSGTTFKGVITSAAAATTRSTNVSSETVFGTGYDYNLANDTFTITGVLTGKNWANNSDELIGTYSCLNGTTSCTTLYYIGHKQSATQASVGGYVIGNITSYTDIGTSYYNVVVDTPALVGYMYNKVYIWKGGTTTAPTGTFASDVSWNGSSYSLSSNTANALDTTHHYLCDDNACSSVRYYYAIVGSTTKRYYYILLENGKKVEDALKEMFNYKTNVNDANENINVYNSAVKGYIDNWYKKNILGTQAENYLDKSAVYCNDRFITDLGGFNKNGGTAGSTYNLKFKQSTASTDLSCSNVTDRMSVNNREAKLTYPIGLLTEPERGLMGSTYAATGSAYYSISPAYYGSVNLAFVNYVGTSGTMDSPTAYLRFGIRPVITLLSSAIISDGDGSTTNPYVVGPIVDRSN